MAGAISKITKTSVSKLLASNATKLCSNISYSKYAHQGGSVDPSEADRELDALTQKSKEGLEDYNKDDNKQNGYGIKETAEEAVESIAVKAKEGANKAAETAKAAKEKGKSMWEAAKDSREKMKESVVGNPEVGKDGGVVEDHVPEQKVYEDIVESGKKVGNIDHEKQNYSN